MKEVNLLQDLPALKIDQSGRTFYISVLPVSTIVSKFHRKDFTFVDWYDPNKEKGFQREPVQKRIKKMALKFKNNTDLLLPTSILLGLRGKVNYSNGKISIPENCLPLSIIDGQHRIFALKEAVEKNEAEHLLNIHLPVVILDETNQKEEMIQFYQINSTQKKIDSSLIQSIIALLKDEISISLIDTPKISYTLIEVTKSLAKESDSPWYGHIYLAGDTKSSSHLVTQASFTSSLAPIFKPGSPLADEYGQIAVNKAVKALKIYWEAIGDLYPEANKNKKKYSIYKVNPGITAFHTIAPHVFRIAAASFSKKKIVDVFKEAFSNITDSEWEDVGDVTFWRVGSRAGSYGGKGGAKKISDAIITALPENKIQL